MAKLSPEQVKLSHQDFTCCMIKVIKIVAQKTEAPYTCCAPWCTCTLTDASLANNIASLWLNIP